MSAHSIPATVKRLVHAAGSRTACTLAGLALFAAGPALADGIDDVDGVTVDGAPEELVLDSVMITSHRTIDEIRDQPVSVSAIAVKTCCARMPPRWKPSPSAWPT